MSAKGKLMDLMARVIRFSVDGSSHPAIVNPAQVRYVYYKGHNRSYIAFGDEIQDKGVTPIGVDVDHSIEEVEKLLNRPYWRDFWLKIGALLLSAGIIAVTIWAGS